MKAARACGEGQDAQKEERERSQVGDENDEGSFLRRPQKSCRRKDGSQANADATRETTASSGNGWTAMFSDGKAALQGSA